MVLVHDHQPSRCLHGANIITLFNGKENENEKDFGNALCVPARCGWLNRFRRNGWNGSPRREGEGGVSESRPEDSGCAHGGVRTGCCRGTLYVCQGGPAESGPEVGRRVGMRVRTDGCYRPHPRREGHDRVSASGPKGGGCARMWVCNHCRCRCFSPGKSQSGATKNRPERRGCTGMWMSLLVPCPC